MAVPRVLVVDDDETIRMLITVNLELEGFEVHQAVDGLDALAKVGAVDPHVITLDVMMPNLDGLDTAARLRADEATAHHKIVMLSARALPPLSPPLRPRASAAGSLPVSWG